MDVVFMAEFSKMSVTPKAFQNNSNLFFGCELAAGGPFDILNELFGLFISGFSLPELICNLLYRGLLFCILINCFLDLGASP